MQLDTPNKLSTTTVALHWVVGLTVIGLLVVGLYMENTETYSLYPWHKSIGFIIFFVILARVVWRIKNGWPSPVGQHQAWERTLARIIHWVLVIGIILMPISGFLMSSMGGSGVAVFGLEIVPRNPDPADPTQTVPHNGSLASLFRGVHHWVGYILVIAVFLHVAGALKHHLIDKDGTLKRMLGGRV